MIGLFLPGNSIVHRLPAGVKLLLLLACTIGVLQLGTPIAVGIGAGVSLALLAMAGIPVRTAISQLLPMLVFLLPLFAVQVLTLGLTRATVVAGQLVILLTIATLVTLTTRVSAMLDVFGKLLRPLRFFRVDPDRIALVLALTIRCIPLVSQSYNEVRDARRARGLEWSPRALAVPLVIRLIKKADEIGEALAARGVDD